MVKCELCDHEGKLIARHIISVHGITTKEYKEKFPNSEISTQEFKQAQKNKDMTNLINSISESNKRKWKDPIFREKMVKTLSDSMKRRLGVVEK